MAADFRVDLNGQSALVTGAGSGPGRAIALALAAAGAAVCVNDMNPDRLDRVVEVIQAQGGRALTFTGDVSKRFAVSAMIEALRDAFGGVQIVVNAMLVDRRAAFLDLDEYDWRRVLDMNLGGAFNCTQLAGRVMVGEGGGVVVNVLSDAVSALEPDSAAHAASQAGLVALTRASAQALASQGVRVNAVVAGSSALAALVEPDAAAQIALENVARAVLFLCSPRAREVVGQVLRANGTPPYDLVI